MPRFPKSEAQIAALAERLYRGMLDNNAIFPQPPIHPMLVRVKKTLYQSRHDNFLAARAAAESATAAKDEKLGDLVTAMKSDLLYAENTVDYDDDKLKLIGWAGKKTKTPLAVPGQVRLLEAVKQGAGWLTLDWKAPADGGKAAAYTIQRRERPAESGAVPDRWQSVATAILTEATLVDQPRGAELEYRVIALNKTGSGTPSNTVEVVL